MEIDIKVEGLREAEAALLKLDSATAVKALNSALMSASLPTFKRAKANMAKYPNFASSLRRKSMRSVSHKTGRIDIKKGFRRSATKDMVTGVSVFMPWIVPKNPGDKGTTHFHLLDQGTKKRRTKGFFKKRANRGAVKAQRFLEDSFVGKEQESIDIFSKRINARINKITKEK